MVYYIGNEDPQTTIPHFQVYSKIKQIGTVLQEDWYAVLLQNNFGLKGI
jgi:hypothetical protein